MNNEEKSGHDIAKPGLFSNFSFRDLLGRRVSGDEERSIEMALDAKDVAKNYPNDALDIIDFIQCVLSRRQPIVEKLKEHPELNDHGFFMVICKVYRDTFLGIGHSNERLAQLITMFSTTEISRPTAARILKKANEANVFVIKKDKIDKRKRHYFLHNDMIELCSHAFSGMISDASTIRDRSAKES